jgi:hypothetical protein
VLFDQDLQSTHRNAPSYKYINQFIEISKNQFTKNIDSFEQDIETYLGVSTANIRPDIKPLNLMWKFKEGEISQDKLDNLKEKIIALV